MLKAYSKNTSQLAHNALSLNQSEIAKIMAETMKI